MKEEVRNHCTRSPLASVAFCGILPYIARGDREISARETRADAAKLEVRYSKEVDLPPLDNEMVGMAGFPNSELLKWYDGAKRDLPWRGTKDPYLIWVSEIILQQTRVDQGLPYYERFTERFTTIQDFAAASEDEVLKIWEGLGYYSRARNMHATAKFVADELNGIFPSDYEGLLDLKGVGPYTAAAIGSIAYGLPNASVDGNVIRVVSRYFGIRDSVHETATKKQINEFAQQILNKEKAGDHNQAMMELGATCCSPSTPNCADCPLNQECVAFAENLQKAIPAKTKKTKVRDRYFYYKVYTDGISTILHRRAAGDIWQGLYEFPLFESEKELEEDDMLALMKLPKDHRILTVSEKFKHILSHQRILARFVLIKVEKLEVEFSKQVKLTELCNFALPRLINCYLEKDGSLLFEQKVLSDQNA